MSQRHSSKPSYGASARRGTTPRGAVASGEDILASGRSDGGSTVLGICGSPNLVSQATCAAKPISICTAESASWGHVSDGTSRAAGRCTNDICRMMPQSRKHKMDIPVDSNLTLKPRCGDEGTVMASAPASLRSGRSMSSSLSARRCDSSSINEASVVYNSLPCSFVKIPHSNWVSNGQRMHTSLYRPQRSVSSPRTVESPQASHTEFGSIEMVVNDSNEHRSFYSCTSDSRAPCDVEYPHRWGNRMDGTMARDRLYEKAHQQLERAISLLSRETQFNSSVSNPRNASDSAALCIQTSDKTVCHIAVTNKVGRHNRQTPTSHIQHHETLPFAIAGGASDHSSVLRRALSFETHLTGSHLDSSGILLLTPHTASAVSSEGSRINWCRSSDPNDVVERATLHSKKEAKWLQRSEAPGTYGGSFLQIQQHSLQQGLKTSYCHKLSGPDDEKKVTRNSISDTWQVYARALPKAACSTDVAYNNGRCSLSVNVGACLTHNGVLRLPFLREESFRRGCGMHWATLPVGIPSGQELPRTRTTGTEPLQTKHKHAAKHRTQETAAKWSESAYISSQENVLGVVSRARTSSLNNSIWGVRNITVRHQCFRSNRIVSARFSSEPACRRTSCRSISIVKSGLRKSRNESHRSVLRTATTAKLKADSDGAQIATPVILAKPPIKDTLNLEEDEAIDAPSPILIDEFAENVKGCISKLIARFPSGTQLHNGYGALKVPPFWTEVPERKELVKYAPPAGENVDKPVTSPVGHFSKQLGAILVTDEKAEVKGGETFHFNEDGFIYKFEAETGCASKASCYYSVEDVLGRGAHGAVFLARRFVKTGSSSASDEVDIEEDVVAVKVMDIDAALRTQCVDAASRLRYLEQIISEMKILPMLIHENIVRFYEAFQWPPCYAVIVTEYLPGGSLKDLYAQCGPLPEPIIAPLLQDVTRALAYLHSDENKIVHRDVKAANILLTEGGHAKLVDFGISTNFTGNLREFVGTPPWMAPEVASLFWSVQPAAPKVLSAEENVSEPQHQHACDLPCGYSYEVDIWSLGITAYEIATGKLPWPSRLKVKELMERISKGPPPKINLNEGYEKTFCFFVEKCLRKAPVDRGSASELLTHSFFQKFCSGKRLQSIHELREAVEIFNGRKQEQQQPKGAKKKVQVDTLMNWGRNSSTLKSAKAYAKPSVPSQSPTGVNANQPNTATLAADRYSADFLSLHAKDSKKTAERCPHENSCSSSAKSSNSSRGIHTAAPPIPPFAWPVADSEEAKSHGHQTEMVNNMQREIEQSILPNDDYLGVEGAALIDTRKVETFATRDREAGNGNDPQQPLLQQSSHSLLSSFLAVFMRSASSVKQNVNEQRNDTLICSDFPTVKQMEADGSTDVPEDKSATCAGAASMVTDCHSCTDKSGICSSTNELDATADRYRLLPGDSACASPLLAPKPFRKTRQNKDKDRQGKVGRETKLFANARAEGFMEVLRRVGFSGTSEVASEASVETEPFPRVPTQVKKTITTLPLVCRRDETNASDSVTDGGYESPTETETQESSATSPHCAAPTKNADMCDADFALPSERSGCSGTTFVPYTNPKLLKEAIPGNPLGVANIVQPIRKVEVKEIYSSLPTFAVASFGLPAQNPGETLPHDNGDNIRRIDRCNSEETRRPLDSCDQWRGKMMQHSETDISVFLQSTDIDAVEQYMKLTATKNAGKLVECTLDSSGPSTGILDSSKRPLTPRSPSATPSDTVNHITNGFNSTVEVFPSSSVQERQDASYQDSCNESLQVVNRGIRVQVPLYRRLLGGISALVEDQLKSREGSSCRQEADNGDTATVGHNESEYSLSPVNKIRIQQPSATQVSDQAVYQTEADPKPEVLQPSCDEPAGSTGWFWALWGRQKSVEARGIASQTRRVEGQWNELQKHTNDLEVKAVEETQHDEPQQMIVYHGSECALRKAPLFDSQERRHVFSGMLHQACSSELPVIGVQSHDFAYQRYASSPIPQLRTTSEISRAAPWDRDLHYRTDVSPLGFHLPNQQADVPTTQAEAPMEINPANQAYVALARGAHISPHPLWTTRGNVIRSDLHSGSVSCERLRHFRQPGGATSRGVRIPNPSNTMGIPQGHGAPRSALGLEGLSSTTHSANQEAQRNDDDAGAINIGDLLQLEKFSHSSPNS